LLTLINLHGKHMCNVSNCIVRLLELRLGPNR
jgi:hypothetical protein